MKIRAIELGRAQRGWVCDVTFTSPTVAQFSDQEMTVSSGGRWLLSAIWNGWIVARAQARKLRDPDGRMEKGWSD